jgi:ABC-type lipoprotein export system ATPase subunit
MEKGTQDKKSTTHAVTKMQLIEYILEHSAREAERVNELSNNLSSRVALATAPIKNKQRINARN